MTTKTTEQRFWEKVEWRANGCLEWVGAIGWSRPEFGKHRGLPYGRFYWNQRLGMAHRYAYERVHGPVPAGLEIDHKCHNTRCVNDEHLEAVTKQVNMERAPGNASWGNAQKTHCPNGHPFDDDNTYIYPGNGARECRRCHADRTLERNRAKGAPERVMASDTHCANGHAWAEGNERWVKGMRRCKTCMSAASLRSRRLRREHNKQLPLELKE
jgi:hypothetical protein